MPENVLDLENIKRIKSCWNLTQLANRLIFLEEYHPSVEKNSVIAKTFFKRILNEEEHQQRSKGETSESREANMMKTKD
ncbi:Selenoprotein K [Manis javanica]|nr:Selenoprotein K [Manis javanica]